MYILELQKDEKMILKNLQNYIILFFNVFCLPF